MLAALQQDSTFEKLRASPFAAELTDKQCLDLSTILQSRYLRNNEYLLWEGQRDDSLHIVVRGSLAVVKNAGTSEEVISFLKEGGLAGAMGFIDGQEHSATLRSIGEVEVLTLKRDKLEQLLGSNASLVYYVMRAVIRSVHGIVRNMNDQYVQLTNYITKQRGRY